MTKLGLVDLLVQLSVLDKTKISFFTRNWLQLVEVVIFKIVVSESTPS